MKFWMFLFVAFSVRSCIALLVYFDCFGEQYIRVKTLMWS
jgi:hypothetical protein